MKLFDNNYLDNYLIILCYALLLSNYVPNIYSSKFIKYYCRIFDESI